MKNFLGNFYFFFLQYAANIKKDPYDFVGDYVFDEPRRDEKFSTLATIVSQCVMRYQEKRG